MDDKEFNKLVGRRIYERRKQLNVTQEQLAEYTDTTPQAISNYERGARELKASAIVRIAEALRTTADYLLSGKENAFAVDMDLSEISSAHRKTIYEIVNKCLELLE